MSKQLSITEIKFEMKEELEQMFKEGEITEKEYKSGIEDIDKF